MVLILLFCSGTVLQDAGQQEACSQLILFAVCGRRQCYSTRGHARSLSNGCCVIRSDISNQYQAFVSDHIAASRDAIAVANPNRKRHLEINKRNVPLEGKLLIDATAVLGDDDDNSAVPVSVQSSTTAVQTISRLLKMCEITEETSLFYLQVTRFPCACCRIFQLFVFSGNDSGEQALQGRPYPGVLRVSALCSVGMVWIR